MKLALCFLIVLQATINCTGRDRKDLHTPKDNSSNQTNTPPAEENTPFTPLSAQENCIKEGNIWRWEKCLTIDEAIATECATTSQGVFIPATEQQPAYCKHPEPTSQERCLSSGYQYQWKDHQCIPKDFLAWCLDTKAPIGIQHTINSLLWTIGQNPDEKDCVNAANQLARSTTITLSMEHLSRISGNDHYSPIIDLEPIRILSYSTEKLDLSGHQIKDLEAIKELNKLKDLNLSYNQIEDATPLSQLYQLQKLSLQHNLITTIDWAIELQNIEGLYLSHNNIEHLKPLITPKHGWPHFTTLDLNQNKISNSEPLESLSRLKHLYIENNKIHHLQFLNVLLHLKTVHLHGNPLTPQSLKSITDITSSRNISIHH
ncbi:MAG: leucine-rich repeat domain-containing protein [Oligoflexales bacterium]